MGRITNAATVPSPAFLSGQVIDRMPTVRTTMIRSAVHLVVTSALVALITPVATGPLVAESGQLSAADDGSLRAAAVKSFPEFLEFLAIPNDSIVPANIQRNAAWLEAAFRRRGFRTRLLENKGKPLVFAEHPGNRPGRKTVLYYIHFDGQPVVPSQWSQKDPWRPVVKRRGADGSWTEVDASQLLRTDFDPELRIFARSASDDKGPILMFLAAIDFLASRKLEPATNVKVILDSEEEVNSPGIAAVIGANSRLLQADALVILDGPVHQTGRPTVAFGNRGIVTVTLRVFGPRSPLHSGHYGNYVPNPAQRLAELLATMKDDDGRVTVVGYYDRTKLTAADRTLLSEIPDDERALRTRVGISASEKVGATYQESLQYPSLNVRGLASAGVGEKSANIVPHEAIAEIDLRTTPDADAAYLIDLLRTHVQAQGYHLVGGEPTDDDRVRYPKIAELRVGLAAAAARQPYDSPVGRWVTSALEAAFASPAGGMKPVRIRMMGGTVPTHEIVTPLNLPFVIVPLVNADNNQHAFDENLRVGNYLSGMRSILGLFGTTFPE